ncbi:MAG: CocE/NonD family hydrolase, partial [Candidatus Helarchaeota archaeon]|nr:CocE/NonD family hydrolase [Candidatus Helarchaeota archaeon]
MKPKGKYVFNPADVEFGIETPKAFDNEKLNRALDSLIIRMVPFMDYIQAPLGGLLNSLGRGILRIFGVGPFETKAIRLKEHLLPMHDGVTCPTDVYLPIEVFKKRSKAPTILVRLPYWKNMLSILGYLFASKGYVTVLQDIRGCASAIPYGTMDFTYFVRQDGLTTLKWISKRFWYNGKLGMWGISFLGVTQLGVSWDNGGLVTCLSPAQCSYTSILYHPGGLTPLGDLVSILRLILGITQNVNPALTTMLKGAEGAESISEDFYFDPILTLYNDPIDNSRALMNLADLSKVTDSNELIKRLYETYNLNLNFNERDKGSFAKFIKDVVLTRRLNINYEYMPYAFGFEEGRLNTPMLIIAAWNDLFIEHILRDAKFIQEKMPEYFKRNFKLVIGPGAHAGMDMLMSGMPPTLPNGKKLMQLYQQFAPFWWYDHWLKNDGHDLSKVPPIRLYVMKKGLWRNFSQWPPKVLEKTLYLHSTGKANSRFGDGTLSDKAPQTDPPDLFDFDPSNPVVTRGGRFLMLKSGFINQGNIEERPDVLVYTSEKLEEGLELIGEVKVVLYAASSAKDTDFTVKLVDVHNERKATLIVDSAIRTRFRAGLKNPTLIEPHKVYKYEFLVGSIAIYVPKSHQLRVEISSSSFPRFDVNSNLAGEKGAKAYAIAHQK